jgi:hypothetical protein
MTKRRPMSEQEWQTAISPYLMIQHLHQHAKVSRVPGGQRRLRLFRCACCRAIWDFFDDAICQQAVEMSERYADQAASRAELSTLQASTEEVAQAAGQQMGEVFRRCSAKDMAWKNASLFHAITTAARWTVSTQFGPRISHIITMTTQHAGAVLAGESQASLEPMLRQQEQERLQAHFLRDIFGNPFQPLTFNPSWLTPTVQALAQGAYDQRTLPAGILDNDRLAVLADALEDASCTDQVILGHLRGPGPHVRGCAVLDAILGNPRNTPS